MRCFSAKYHSSQIKYIQGFVDEIAYCHVLSLFAIFCNIVSCHQLHILRHKVAPQNKITAARFPPALKAGGEKEIENSICVATHHFILKAKHNTFLLLSFGTGFRNLFFYASKN